LDVHGYAIALEAVLADLERDPVDQVVCLGDAVQGGCQPAEVIELLRRVGCPVVLGNADAFVLDADAGVEVPNQRQLDVREWTRERVGPDGLAYIETFEPTLEVPLGRRTLLAFHGSPVSYDDVILPHVDDDEFRRLLGPPRADVLAGGHVHLQWLRPYGESTFMNPGSVSLPYDHVQLDEDLHFDACAAYARIETDDDGIEITFRRIEFDRDAVLAAIASSGIPHADSLSAQWLPREA
jgi:predicted phosphodiesterase